MNYRQETKWKKSPAPGLPSQQGQEVTGRLGRPMIPDPSAEEAQECIKPAGFLRIANLKYEV